MGFRERKLGNSKSFFLSYSRLQKFFLQCIYFSGFIAYQYATFLKNTKISKVLLPRVFFTHWKNNIFCESLAGIVSIAFFCKGTIFKETF